MEDCWYLQKKPEEADEGCRLCPLRSDLTEQRIRVLMAGMAVNMLAPSALVQVEDGQEEQHAQAIERLTRAQAEAERAHARAKRAFATCVGPCVLSGSANNQQFSVTVCTSPDAYIDGKMRVTTHARVIPGALPHE